MQIIDITKDAISILDMTNSIKRLGILLESIIAKDLIKTDFQNELSRLEKHMSLTEEHKKTNIKYIYKI